MTSCHVLCFLLKHDFQVWQTALNEIHCVGSYGEREREGTINRSYEDWAGQTLYDYKMSDSAVIYLCYATEVGVGIWP